MIRGKIIAVAVLVIIGLLVYFTLPREKDGAKKQVEPFFARTLGALIRPPNYATARGTDHKIIRLLDRIQWGTSKSVNWSITCLKNEPERPFLKEVMERIDRLGTAKPAAAKRYIDLLAELDEQMALPFLIEYSDNPVEMIRHAALKGVGRFDQMEATQCLLRQVGSSNPRTRKLALDLLSASPDLEALAFFQKKLVEGDVEILAYAMKALTTHGGSLFRPLLQKNLDHEDFAIRTTALRCLLELEDPAANQRLRENLEHPGPVMRRNAVLTIPYAKELPPLEVLEKLARDQDGSLRLLLAQVLVGRTKEGGEEEKPSIRKILGIMKNDPRLEISLKAQEGLYHTGLVEIGTPFLKALEKSFGGSLKEAVLFVTEILALKETAGPLLIDRFRNDPDLSPTDRLVLLDGLSVLQYPEAVDLFFEVIGGQWDAGETLNPPFTLDRSAAFKVHNLGDVMPQWLEILENENSDDMAYLFINGARNLGDARAAEKLLELASDVNRPLWLRKEGILTFPFLQDTRLGEMLLNFVVKERNKELADLADKVFWNFF